MVYLATVRNHNHFNCNNNGNFLYLINGANLSFIFLEAYVSKVNPLQSPTF